MRILLVEDDRKIASFIAKGLRETGYAVDHAADGEDGLHLASTESYDAAVIDIMLPKLDGLSLIETLRQYKINTPVIILSAKRSVDDRVKGLQAGGSVYLDAGRGAYQVAITVRDTGAGIHEEELPKIWDRLYRSDQSRLEKGLGLGLSLVRAVLGAHGGQVDVFSEPGKGSTFTVSLPLDG